MTPKRSSSTDRYIIMLGPSSASMGGVTAVVNAYRSAGLFDIWPLRYVDTYVDSGVARKLWAWVAAFGFVLWFGVRGQVQGLHIHVAIRTSFWRKSMFMLLAGLFRWPYILHLHGADFDVFYEKECSEVAKRYIRWCFRRSAAVIVLSESWKKWVASTISGMNLWRIYNPVKLHESLAVHGARRSLSDILFLGQLGARKGIVDLVKALSIVRARYPNVHLWCGGDGDPREVEGAIRELDLAGNVSLLGWVAGEAREDLFNRTAFLVLPSYHEGLPMAILEAMAAGMPVIATAVGGIPEAIEDGSEGFLIVPGDVSGLAAAIERMLSDDEARTTMGENAREKIRQRFEDVKIIKNVSELYGKVGFVRR